MAMGECDPMGDCCACRARVHTGREQEPRKHVAPAVAESHSAKSPWRPLAWVQ